MGTLLLVKHLKDENAWYGLKKKIDRKDVHN